MYGRWDPHPLVVLVEFPEPDVPFFFILQLTKCRGLFQVLEVKICSPPLVTFRYWFLSKAFEGRYLWETNWCQKTKTTLLLSWNKIRSEFHMNKKHACYLTVQLGLNSAVLFYCNIWRVHFPLKTIFQECVPRQNRKGTDKMCEKIMSYLKICTYV